MADCPAFLTASMGSRRGDDLAEREFRLGSGDHRRLLSGSICTTPIDAVSRLALSLSQIPIHRD